jgi:putative FmdB family regulatory protein
MPIYPYLCTSCEEESEVTQRITEDRLTLCPDCGADSKDGGPGLKRQIGGGGSFVWKGGAPTSKTYV